ncbi:MAG: hypothetical protein CSA66_05075 [Proteobacteria bacterium]|nr:MAG: hypothetical protein CSA66_05075 [Pseudomonadota bacterium]
MTMTMTTLGLRASALASAVLLLLTLLSVGCAGPELDGYRFACASDDDCAGGLVCGASKVCVPSDQVDEDTSGGDVEGDTAVTGDTVDPDTGAADTQQSDSSSPCSGATYDDPHTPATESLPEGASCGTGACVGGTVICVEGQLVCDKDGASAERCDGVDNDCDGATDEDFTYEGAAIGLACVGVGACGAGVVECIPGDTSGATCSTNPNGSEPGVADEVCDTLDNDCDGQTNEDLTDVAASTCLQVGVCATGVADIVATCQEDGTWACDYSGVVGYQADVELSCDGLDNDCDDGTDDEFGVGVGCDGDDDDDCANGVVSCGLADSNTTTWCDESGAQSVVEVCDGLDNDCDNQTDEDFKPGGTVTFDGGLNPADAGRALGDSCGTGRCANGTVSCDPTDVTAMVCASPLGPVAELCDGVDNDCDGLTDEDFTYQGAAIGEECVGVGGCGAGVVECSRTEGVGATCSSNLDGSMPGDSPELCDGVDNDCDGQTNEDVVDLDQADCLSQGVCAAPGAVVVASCTVDGQWLCDYQGVADYQAGAEAACDGKDNDCDGFTDDEFGVGAACDGDDADQCANGVVECDPLDPTATVCDESAQAVEICDSEDNDCDGLIDEDFTDGTITYDFPPTEVIEALRKGDECGVGVCVGGVVICDGSGGMTCSSLAAAGQEVCDGEDNDCDGVADEGVVPTWYPDCDGDGFFADRGIDSCEEPWLAGCGGAAPQGGWTTVTPQVEDIDCDDFNPKTHPGAEEICFTMSPITYEGFDNDCDGGIDEGCPKTHCGSVGDESWGPGVEHLVTCDVEVDWSTLEIQAGAVVSFVAQTALKVGTHFGGELKVAGTGTSPVIFKADDTWVDLGEPLPGHWGGIRLGERSNGSYIESAKISHGVVGVAVAVAGTSSVSLTDIGVNYSAEAGLQVESGTVVVKESSFANSGGDGVRIAPEGRAQLQGVVLEANRGSGLYCQDRCLTGDGVEGGESSRNHGSAYVVHAADWGKMHGPIAAVGNGANAVVSTIGEVYEDARWEDLGVPFRQRGSDLIFSGAGKTLIIDTGTEIQLEGSGRFTVGGGSGWGVPSNTLQFRDASSGFTPVVIGVGPQGVQDGVRFVLGSRLDWGQSVVSEFKIEGGAMEVTSYDANNPVTLDDFQITSPQKENGLWLKADDIHITQAQIEKAPKHGIHWEPHSAPPEASKLVLRDSWVRRNGGYGVNCVKLHGCEADATNWDSVDLSDNERGPYNTH